VVVAADRIDAALETIEDPVAVVEDPADGMIVREVIALRTVGFRPSGHPYYGAGNHLFGQSPIQSSIAVVSQLLRDAVYTLFISGAAAM
jgi:hypothetical protein